MTVNELVPWRPGVIVGGMIDGKMPLGDRKVDTMRSVAQSLADHAIDPGRAAQAQGLKNAVRAAQTANGAIHRMMKGTLGRD